MKKFITLSAFLFLVILSLIAKSSNAQVQTNLVARPVVAMLKPVCTPTSGYWTWNRRTHMHVWVDGRRFHSHNGYRMRHS